MKLLHGSPHKLDHFQQRKGFQDAGFGKVEVTHHGHYFTDDHEVANHYAGPGGHVHHVDVDIKNPLDLRNGLTEKDEAHLETHGMYTRRIHNVDHMHTLFDDEDGKDFVHVLKKAGYDGVKFREHNIHLNKNHDTIVAFDNSQIKINKIHSLKEDEAPTVAVSNNVISTEPVVSKEQQKRHIKSFKKFKEDMGPAK